MNSAYTDEQLGPVNHPRNWKATLPSRRSIASLLTPLDQIAAGSLHLIANHGASFEHGGDTYKLPRYLFVGPKGGGEPLRIGIFAGVHGDEPEGIHALVRFLTLLESEPELGDGQNAGGQFLQHLFPTTCVNLFLSLPQP